MFITKNIQEIKSLASSRVIKDQELGEKHGVGVPNGISINLGDPKSLAYLDESYIAAHPLEQYLKLLDIHTLEYLVTLMYAGRDQSAVRDAKGFENFHNSIMSLGFKDDKAKCELAIREKVMNLNIYYSNSINLANELSFDIDACFK